MSFSYQAIQTGQTTATAAATQVVPAYTSRSGIIIVNTGTTDCYIGENASVTTLTGCLLTGTKGASISFSTTGAVYAITGGGSATLTWLETN